MKHLDRLWGSHWRWAIREARAPVEKGDPVHHINGIFLRTHLEFHDFYLWIPGKGEKSWLSIATLNKRPFFWQTQRVAFMHAMPMYYALVFNRQLWKPSTNGPF